MAKRAKVVQRRAAFDIGSGATKLMIADVDGSTVTQQVFGKEVPVAFAVDWKQSSDGQLSEEIQAKGLEVLRSFLSTCDEHAVPTNARCAIATEVFRKASNGTAYLERVQALGLPVKMLSQSEEAEVGFKTAVALQDGPAKDVICWDSGGASFQITSRNSGGSLCSYLGSLGTGVVTSILVETVKGQNFAEVPSPNPVTVQEAEALVKELKTKIPEAPEWLRSSCVTAIGGPNSMFTVTCEALGKTRYAADDVRSALRGVLEHTDAELASEPFCQGELREPPAYIVPKICQLLAVIEHCGIKEVHFCSAIGSCPGMLISNNLFSASE
eukprot:TRINITY_DN106837_c0_g1_i1.p1 TRINITY_DN106837_c0_g1~~TRINITY_DN106837_c0_g1_i1.p1  ORF type:complete len:341 (+),score=71.65 TRINITY_DN106837_c0_g1_i1:45-1025(+)